MTMSKRLQRNSYQKKKKSKNGSFAQIKMYSRKPKENIGNAKIGDCRNSNLNHTPEIKPLKMQGELCEREPS